MRVSSVYESFVQHYRGQVDLLREYLQQNNMAESIYLLGVTERTRRTETLFTTSSARASWLVHYYLLAVVPSQSTRTVTLVQDILENRLRYRYPATVVVLRSERLQQWFTGGHPFATAVLTRAELLAGVPQPFGSIAPKKVLCTATPDQWAYGIDIVRQFVAGAEMYRKSRAYGLAAFMLHQATERGLQQLLRITTGLEVRTHNLDKLVRYCMMATGKLEEIFYGAGVAGRILFKKLQHAYIDARYKQFNISEGQLVMIEAKIAVLVDVLAHERMILGDNT
jgi:HEPN domain-containing protein